MVKCGVLCEVRTGFLNIIYTSFGFKQRAEVIQSHQNVNVRNIGQGEAQHRKYKRLKLGGNQAYDRSSD
jgi:hypothetical protein